MAIDDIARKYGKNEGEFLHILFDDLKNFDNKYCPSCNKYNCEDNYKREKCFETYLLSLGYTAVCKKKFDVNDYLPKPEIDKKKKKK